MTEPREHVLEPMVQHIGRRLTLKQSANGTFIIGGGWPARTRRRRRGASRRRWESTAGNAAVAMRVVPLLADVRIVRTWSGVMAFTADLHRSSASPHASPASTPDRDDGFTLEPADGPAAGRVDGDRPRHDSADYAVDRTRRAGAQSMTWTMT